MKLHHRFDGDPSAPVVVLAGSLGSTLAMWDPQAISLAGRFLVVRYDHPGHGGSPVSDGPVAIDDLGRAALALLDELGLERVSFCGLSLGGMVGMWLASHAPDRIERLVLCCTAARLATRDFWDERAATVRRAGVAAIANAVLARWFTPDFRKREAAVVDRFRQMLVSTDAEGYARCCEAIRDLDLRDDLRSIAAPTLVLTGADDPAIARADVDVLLNGIPDVQHVELERAAHLANVEQPEAFDGALLEHLAGVRA